MHLSIILVNNQLDAHFFAVYVYFDTLHVSSNYVLIIRRINCINMTLYIYIYMYVCVCVCVYIYIYICVCVCVYKTYCNFRPFTCSQSDIHQTSGTDTIDSPDDVHMVARNM